MKTDQFRGAKTSFFHMQKSVFFDTKKVLVLGETQAVFRKKITYGYVVEFGDLNMLFQKVLPYLGIVVWFFVTSLLSII